MEMNTATLSDFVKLATVLWEDAYHSVPQVMRGSGLYNVTPIPANTGNTREFSEIDGEEYAKIKGEGDQAARAKVQQGYSKTMSQYRVAKDIGITYEMRTQNKYPEIVKRLTSIGYQAANRMDLDMAHRITFGTSYTYTNMDGDAVDISTGQSSTQQLFDTNHGLRGSSTTYRNRLANNPRLSKGALEGMERLAVEETYNQFGEKMTMGFDILWTTDDPNTCNTAKEYLQSTADVEGSHEGVINVYKSKYRHVELPRIATDASGAPDSDKRYYWGIASSMSTTAYLGIWEEPHLKTPSDLNAGEEFSTDDWNFGVRGGYGLAIVSAAWIKMSSGDGQA
jgi:hypothetical protein